MKLFGLTILKTKSLPDDYKIISTNEYKRFVKASQVYGIGRMEYTGAEFEEYFKSITLLEGHCEEIKEAAQEQINGLAARIVEFNGLNMKAASELRRLLQLNADIKKELLDLAIELENKSRILKMMWEGYVLGNTIYRVV